MKNEDHSQIVPYSLKDVPSLIEIVWPTEKISAESQKERKSGSSQTLTGLGSYWKGRKPLILTRACILGILLPATDDLDRDVIIFEKLMGMSDEFFGRRYSSGPKKFAKLFPKYADKVAVFSNKVWKNSKSDSIDRKKCAEELIKKIQTNKLSGEFLSSLEQFVNSKDANHPIGDVNEFAELYPEFQQNFTEDEYNSWRTDIDDSERELIIAEAFRDFPYSKRLDSVKRTDEFEESELLDGIWQEVNAHIGTNAFSIIELVTQLGIMRFGRCPKFADTFSGSGSICYEASRMGCDSYASDLNPIACMLTWGGNYIIGAENKEYDQMQKAQGQIISEIEEEIRELGIEHDESGNQGKNYLYCIETKCPRTGWMVPLSPTWIIAKPRGEAIKLIPDEKNKRYDFKLVSGLNAKQLEEAGKGTIRKGRIFHPILDDDIGISIQEVRGDYKDEDGNNRNKLRHWDISDFMPRTDDIWQNRIYAIQWLDSDDIAQEKSNPRTFFTTPTEEDLDREKLIQETVRDNLLKWQKSGVIPSIQIETGFNTDQPIRERGWTYWHHLFSPRHLLINALVAEKTSHTPVGTVLAMNSFNKNSALCHWNNSGVKLEDVFYNQALNTFFNYGARGFRSIANYLVIPKNRPIKVPATIKNIEASSFDESVDIFITDPPYADAVQYDEITEFFIAWLKKEQPKPFSDWIWDSRRNLAIKGSGQDFKVSMVEAYRNMTENLSDNGIQIVMFTHQDAKTWSDMALIFWGAELQIVQDWYISTETITGLKIGGYVQGTHIIVVRKQKQNRSAFHDDLIHEIRDEVKKQLDEMLGINQRHRESKSENLFNESDMQMAGYAAALRILTGYRTIEGRDMKQEALKQRTRGEFSVIDELIEFAVQTANEFLVPVGIEEKYWNDLNGTEKFYIRMLDIEEKGAAKLDQFQNFAKAFRVENYGDLMANKEANNANLKTAKDFGKASMAETSQFGQNSSVRIILRAISRVQSDEDVEVVIEEMRDFIPEYYRKHDMIQAIIQYVVDKRTFNQPEEAKAARILETAIKTERL